MSPRGAQGAVPGYRKWLSTCNGNQSLDVVLVPLLLDATYGLFM